MSLNKHIRLEPANNGFEVSWFYENPSLQMSDSYRTEQKEVFKLDEAEEAVAKVAALHRENIEKLKEKGLLPSSGSSHKIPQ